MSAHTPGPWYCGTFRESGKSPGIDIGASNNSNVAIAHHEHLDRDTYETKANARLIAAAPDLLSALEEIARAIEPDGASGVRVRDCHDGNKALRNAIAIVAKARGQS